MDTLRIKIDKISASDPFDQQLSIRGLIYQMTQMNSNLYEYAYYLTFKRACKEYADIFKDAYDMPIDEQCFFLGTGDQLVLNCCSSYDKILSLQRELMRRFFIDEIDNLQDKVAEVQSRRYAPYRLLYKRSKSCKRLKMQYERTLLDYIEYLYKFACVFTASNYRIPLVLKRQFFKEEEASLRLLNSDNDTVALLIEAIIGLRADLEALRQLNVNKKKTRYHGNHKI